MIEPFTIRVEDNVLEDLRRRIVSTRWPEEIAESGWRYGTNLAYIRSLTNYWQGLLLARAGRKTKQAQPLHNAHRRTTSSLYSSTR